ncbi:hypothetical protein [Aliihoeflea sp. PC F10.4]
MAKRKSKWREPELPPPLPVIYPDREHFSEDAHYEAACRFAEERAQIDAVLQRNTRMAAEALGRPAVCRRRACRRARGCVAPLGPNHPLAHLGRILPPCCDTPERAEEARLLVRRWLNG